MISPHTPPGTKVVCCVNPLGHFDIHGMPVSETLTFGRTYTLEAWENAEFCNLKEVPYFAKQPVAIHRAWLRRAVTPDAFMGKKETFEGPIRRKVTA